MSGKKTVTTRTIERDIAALQAKGILKREGGSKSGKWIVVNIKKIETDMATKSKHSIEEKIEDWYSSLC